jgi:transposase
MKRPAEQEIKPNKRMAVDINEEDLQAVVNDFNEDDFIKRSYF